MSDFTITICDLRLDLACKFLAHVTLEELRADLVQRGSQGIACEK